MLTVLYVTYSSDLYGSTQSLYYLIRSVGKEIKPIVLFPNDGPAVELFKNEGIECLAIPYLTVFSKPTKEYKKDVVLHPWRMRLVKIVRYDLRTILYLKKYLKGRKIDIVHTNNSLVSFGKMLSFFFCAKHVWHIREQMHQSPNRVVFGGLSHLKRMMNKADVRVFVSDSCRKWWGLKDNNTYVLFDAVRSVEDCCYEPNKQPYFLFCAGYILKAKGVERAVRAYGISELMHESIGLKVVGEWKEEGLAHEMKALAKSFKCEDSVEFIPFQKDVKSLFSHAMAFINPSENEGMGRTTAEAMFFGCPVVGLASSGTLDLVSHGKTGYLFHTVEECAEIMKKVCHENQEEIILSAQEFVKQNLSVECYGERLMKIYLSVL